MKNIYQYRLHAASYTAVEMPSGAQILSVQMQASTLCLWALVEPDNPLEVRHFWTFLTGQDLIDISMHYLGTYQIFTPLDTYFVGHVFEERKSPEERKEAR